MLTTVNFYHSFILYAQISLVFHTYFIVNSDNLWRHGMTLRNIFHEYKRSEEGQIALIFGLFSMIFVGMSGAAIDISLFEREKVKGQSALDAATLALIDIVGENGVDRAKNDARTFLEANYVSVKKSNSLNLKSLQLNTDQSLRATATLQVESVFGAIFGYKNYNTDLETVVSISAPPQFENINVAIVLDSSTSMTSLISDTRNAIDALYSNIAQNELTGSFALYPFSQYDSNRNGELLLSPRDIWLDNIEISDYISDLSVMTSVPESNVNYTGIYSGTGAACGWEALEQANNAITSINPDTLNIIYFMHDGDGWCGQDDKILESCQAIRDRGIKLVGVRFGSWADKDQLFLDCVGGSPDNYYHATTAEATLSAFVDGAFGNSAEKYIMK